MIKEITKIPSNSFIIINIKLKKLKNYYINYEEHTIPLETLEGLKTIDKWIDKWGYIIRSLKKQTDNISTDLSGGFDTRVILSIFLNSGIDLNKILINTFKDNNICHGEDMKIATNISKKFKFKLNNRALDKKETIWSIKDTLFSTMGSKLGFHKEFFLKGRFFENPRFCFSGGGEIRGYPGLPIEKYVQGISSRSKHLGKEFYNSSKRLCDRSVSFLKNMRTYYNNYQISSDFYSKGRSANHDGKNSLEVYLSNIYNIQPMIDSDIKKIQFNMNGNSTHDLVAYIYLRLAPDLIYFPFQGNRTLKTESVKKAKYLNKIIGSYKIKSDLNDNFYIDFKRKSPSTNSTNNKDIRQFLKELFESSMFIESITKIYDINIYQSAKNFNSTYFPFRYLYGLLSIAIISDNLPLDQILTKSLTYKKNTEKRKRIIEYLLNIK